MSVRVLQVVLSLNPGGTERLVLDLVRRLRADMPMAVCCLDEPGSWGEDLRREGVVVTSLGRRAGFHPSLGRGVAAAVRAHEATVIHAHQYTPYVYAGLSRVWQRRAPVVFTEHGRLSDAPPSGKRRMVNAFLTRLARSRTFAVSDDLRRFMHAEGLGRVGVIYNGIDVGPPASAGTRASVRAELGVAPDGFVIATVARFDPVKSLDTLLHAMALLQDRPTSAVIVGDGPERAGLEAVAREAGVTNRVRFLGQRNDARRWLAGCDAFVNCSTSEGVSLTILEGMAAGLPVVVTRVGGTPEIVTEDCGTLVPPRNPGALAAAIRELADNREAACTKGRNGRAHVAANFTIERMVGAYEQVYRSCVA